MKNWTYWRRRWCAWRGHPMADWSPVVMWESEPDIWTPDGIREGRIITTRAWRCATHDNKENK